MIHSSRRIHDSFTASFRSLDDARAERLERLIGEGDVDDALRQAANDESAEVLQDLLAYRECLRELEDVGRLAGRLRAEAGALEARADGHDEAAAEFFGKAAYRDARGDADLARDQWSRAEAAEKTAMALRDAALTCRLNSARVQCRLVAAQTLTRVTQPA